MSEAPPVAGGNNPPARGDRLEVDIDDLAFGGRGVGRVGGFVVFVRGALPGERVRALVRRRRPGFAEADVEAVLDVSPDRVQPRCEHYGTCGGCDLQHLDAAAQTSAKGRQVREILRRIGRVDDPQVAPALACGEPWGYRFRMDLDWERRKDGRPGLGLHRRDRPGQTFDLSVCHLMTGEAVRLVLWIAARASRLRLRALDRKTGRGLLRRLSLQEARATREILIGLETGRGDPPTLGDLARSTMGRHPRVVGFVRRTIGPDGRTLDESILAGRDHLFEEVGGDRLRVPAAAFFQPNASGAEILRREAIDALGPRPDESILELFAGVGLFSVAIARRAGTLVAIEGSREAAAAARENLARAGGRETRVVQGDVASALPALLAEREWHGILADPPRTGLGPATLAALCGAPCRRLVYVSCDPATMARDLRQLVERGGYRLLRVVPLDLFPQTHHVECVARLERAGGDA